MIKAIRYIKMSNQAPMTLYATQNMFVWRFGA